jgi:hypothetical protein
MSIEVHVKVDVVPKGPTKAPPQAPFPGRKEKEKTDAKFSEVVGKRGAPSSPYAKPLYPKNYGSTSKGTPPYIHQSSSSSSSSHAIVGARKISPPPARTPPIAPTRTKVLESAHAIPGVRNLHGNG